MSMKHLLLLIPLFLVAWVARPAGACATDDTSAAQSPDEEPAAQSTRGLQVAFHVTGMKKTKSGAT